MTQHRRHDNSPLRLGAEIACEVRGVGLPTAAISEAAQVQCGDQEQRPGTPGPLSLLHYDDGVSLKAGAR